MKVTKPKYQAICCQEHTNRTIVQAAKRFRKVVFVDHLGWRLQNDGHLEEDQFDRNDAVYTVLMADDEIVGGFRAIRTDREYLAKSLFAELATTREFPSRWDAWEISRFGIAPQRNGSELAQLNYALLFNFARTRHASSLVAFVDLPHERLLRRFGIRSRRYGPPKVIGTYTDGRPMTLVAGEIPVFEQSARTTRNFHRSLELMEIVDETLFVGRRSLSA